MVDHYRAIVVGGGSAEIASSTEDRRLGEQRCGLNLCSRLEDIMNKVSECVRCVKMLDEDQRCTISFIPTKHVDI